MNDSTSINSNNTAEYTIHQYDTFSIEEEETKSFLPNNPTKLATSTAAKQWHRNNNIHRVLVLSITLTVILLAFLSNPKNQHISPTNNSTPNNKKNHDHFIPTLLSIRDKESGKLVSALDNPLYHVLQHKTTIFESTQESFVPGLLKIDSTTTANTNKDAVIIIQWETVKVENEDILTLHCPANKKHENFIEALYVDQIDASTDDSNYWTYEEMSFWKAVFPPIHYNSCQFRLWRRNTSSSLSGTGLVLQLVSSSDSVILKDEVKGIHLAYTDSPSELVIQFGTSASSRNTNGGGGRADDVEVVPVVLYSTNKMNDSNEDDWAMVTGTTTTYSASDLCAAPANQTDAGHFINPGFLHTIIVTSLLPDTVYFYKLSIANSTTPWSSIHSFISPPPSPQTLLDSNAYNYSIQFLAYGDQGCSASGWTGLYNTTTSHIAREPNTRLITHVGDLSYAVGAAHVWDAWLQMLQPVMTSIPYMISIGNHEYDYYLASNTSTEKDPSGLHEGYHPLWGNYAHDSNGECGIPTTKRFQMPSTGNSVFWYSYNLGFIHFIVISAEHDIAVESSVQYQWLKHDLQTVDRTLTPWIVLQCHRPMYHAEYYPVENTVSTHLKTNLQELLYAYQVDVYIAGHWHSYQRTCPGLYKDQCHTPGGTMHITIGTAGAVLTEFDLYEQDWVDFFIQGNGYGRCIVNRTSLVWEFVSEKKEDGGGEVIDRVVLEK